MAMQKDLSERKLLEDQNKAEKENMESHAPQFMHFAKRLPIFGHDAPSYEAIILAF